jgi:hypothetical protein
MTTLQLTHRSMWKFLASMKMTVIPHPPYPLELAPLLFPIPEDKLKLKGCHFDSSEEIQTESQDVMKMLT